MPARVCPPWSYACAAVVVVQLYSVYVSEYASVCASDRVSVSASMSIV